MKTTTLVKILLASMFLMGGCKSSDPSTRLAAKGEACRTTADCGGSLSCVPSAGAGGGGICVTGEFHVATTAKECVLVQCAVPADCCPKGATTCDATRYTCTNGTCGTVQCTSDSQCFGGKCAGGVCQECTTNANCLAGETCQSGRCQPPCSTDSECPSFNRCVNNACVDSGCQSDRECVAATRNVEATCKEGKCSVPCQTDLECGNPKDYSFYSCISGQCTYVGCVNDKECELYLNKTGGTGGGRATCRDKIAN